MDNKENINKARRQLAIGFLIGILAPVAAFYIFTVLYRPHEAFHEVLQAFVKRNVLTHVISLSAIINLPLFFLFLKQNKESISRGILGATLLYAIYVMYLKLI